MLMMPFDPETMFYSIQTRAVITEDETGNV